MKAVCVVCCDMKAVCVVCCDMKVVCVVCCDMKAVSVVCCDMEAVSVVCCDMKAVCVMCRLEENCGKAIKQQELGELEESFKSYKVCTTSTAGAERRLVTSNLHVLLSTQSELIIK